MKKVEVQAKVKAEIKRARSSLNLDLSLVPVLLRFWLGGSPIDPVENTFVATCQGGRFSHGIVATWRRQDGRQPRGFIVRQVARGLLEVMTGCCLSAIDALSPLGDVEIQFENTLLREMMFEGARNQSFPRLSKQGPFG